MANPEAAALQAGVGKSDISPPPGVPQGGWGAQTHQRSLGNDLPLEVRALALRSGEETALLIDLDAIGFDTPTTSRLLDAVTALTGLSPNSIRLSCTHTHSGANTFRLPMIREGLDMAVSYIESLPSRVAGAAWQALLNLRPARMGIATGESDINVNRRCQDEHGHTFVGCNPAGERDSRVRLLRFDDLDGNIVASVLHYGCHPTTMGWQNEWVTPDFPGQAKRVVDRNLGGTCLFLQGAAADLGPRRGFLGDLNVYRRLGTILGLEAAKLGWNTDTVPTRLVLRDIQESGARIGLYDEVADMPPDPVLRTAALAIDLPLREHATPYEAETEAALRRAELKELIGKAGETELRRANALATQAGMAAERSRLYYGRTSIPWPVHITRIGDIALVGIAGEPFQKIGREIERRSPFAHTLVSGYTNGGFGYIPVSEAYPEGGYEVETTPFAPHAASILVEQISAALQDLHT